MMGDLLRQKFDLLGAHSNVVEPEPNPTTSGEATMGTCAASNVVEAEPKPSTSKGAIPKRNPVTKTGGVSNRYKAIPKKKNSPATLTFGDVDFNELSVYASDADDEYLCKFNPTKRVKPLLSIEPNRKKKNGQSDAQKKTGNQPISI